MVFNIIYVGGGVGGGAGGPDTSCERFVKAIEELRKKFPYVTVSTFVNKMYDRFANSGHEFSSDGFKSKFQDNSNQARHYTGGLWAGYTFGATAGLAGANAREDKNRIYFVPENVGGFTIPVLHFAPETQSQKADKALNAVSTKHGGWLSDGSITPSEIAALVEEEVCD